MQVNNKNIIVFLVSLLFSIFILFYINLSTVDVAYSDYIRLINSYLPNVSDVKNLLRADILTCIPITFLSRFINVNLFSYSIMFDRTLGVYGLFLINVFTCIYMFKTKQGDKEDLPLKLFFLLVISVIVFSLSNWEMMLNGSGYAHFIAIALYIYSFIKLDEIYKIFCMDDFELSKKSALKSNIFKFTLAYTISSLLFAGPYGMIPFVCVILFLLAIKFFATMKHIDGIRSGASEKQSKLVLTNWLVDKTLIYIVIMPFVCFMLYVISNHFAVYEYSGAKNVSFFSILPSTFTIKFILKSFASFLFGIESFGLINISEFLNKKIIYMIGAFVILLYIYSFYLNIRFKIYKKTLLPMLFMIWSLGNVGIVFLSRYIFLNPDYGASSRYYLQYMVGVLGFILSFYEYFVVTNDDIKISTNLRKIFISIVIAIILFLNIVGMRYELIKSKYRKENYIRMYEAAMDIDKYEDEDLVKIFEYRKGAEYIRNAFDILRENKLNVYKDSYTKNLYDIIEESN